MDLPIADEVDRILLEMARTGLVAVLYTLSLTYLGVPIWKALAIAIVVSCCSLAHLGNRALERVALLLVAYSLAVWIGAAPTPSAVQTYVSAFLAKFV